jgi:undecaprenol kinase
MKPQSEFPGSAQKPTKTLWRSFGHALNGWRTTLATQRNVRIQGGIAVLAVLTGLWLGIPLQQWGLIFLAMGLVFAAELANTSIEALVDLVSPEQSSLAAQAKDASAGAVLVASVASVLMGLSVLGPSMLRRLGL